MRQNIEVTRRWPATARTGRVLGGLLLCALVVLTGCGGDNLFGDPKGGDIGAPEVEILSVSPPDTVSEGEYLDVRVHAVSERKVARFDVMLRRAVQDNDTVFVSPALTDVTIDLSYRIPSPVKDSILVISITATDQAGSPSEPVTDTLYVRDITGPTTSVVVEPAESTAGDSVRIRVTAKDNIAVSALGYLVLGAEGDTISLELAPVAGSIADSATQEFTYIVPPTLPPMTVTVLGLAMDPSGLLPEEPAAFQLTIVDRTPPVVAIVRPTAETTYPTGDSVLVEVDVFDNAGIVSATLSGVAFRGDPTLGTDAVVARFVSKRVTLSEPVQDTVLRRYLVATSDRTSEVVAIIAEVTDVNGNVGTDTVEIAIGGPRVEIQSPADGQTVQSGRTVGVRLFAADPSGIPSMQLMYTGVTSDTLVFTFSPVRDSVVVDTAIALPAGVTGTLELTISALNSGGVPGRADPVTLVVEDDVVPDTTRPFLSFTVATRPRMELGDSLRITVTARDNDGGSGLSLMGVTALAINAARPDTLTRSAQVTFAPPRSGTSVRDFTLPPFNADTLTLPDTLTFLIHAFAVDSAGNCAAAVSDIEQQLACGVFKGDTVAAGTTGASVRVVVVGGRTVLLPDGGQIADATVDTIRDRLYLSNFSARKIEALDLVADTFNTRGIDVGAQPWGIGLNRTEDTLIVANSGGTNLSFVPLDGVLAEDGSRRLRTPNVVLYQIRTSKDEFGFDKYEYVGRDGDDFISFSDRPQFVAQDATGLILYSTVPTSSTVEGTIRYVVADPVPATLLDEPEAKLLFTGKAVNSDADNVVIAHVDSLIIVDAPSDMIEIWDHKFGFPDSVISSGVAPIDVAVSNLAALGSDIYAALGTWDLAEIGMSDTTFLALSGDRQWVAFGDGATAPFAQILMWNAANRTLSSDINASDLTENAAERVRGVGLNTDGSLGVAKGAEGVYFFDTALRLQGEHVDPFTAGGSGAVLHPAHPDYRTIIDSDERTLAFVGTGRSSIQIIDTWHFRVRGEIVIRDNIAGPLRATLPLPADLSDPLCVADPQQCVVVKLYGVSDAGGVVIVNVRRRDILD